MQRPTMTVSEAKEQLDAMIQRRIEVRKGLVDAAVLAGSKRAAEVVDALDKRRRPWWPALAPLTSGERAAVYKAIAAGAAAGSADVD
jgi:hypothetical protein